jgi:hypothetical protein
LSPDLQQKLTMQASGYTGLHPLRGTDEGSGLVVIDNCYHTYVAVDSPVTNVHSASFIVKVYPLGFCSSWFFSLI